jgi:hypothetical protein
MQSIGQRRWSEAYDVDGKEQEREVFISHFKGELEKLMQLARVDPLPTKNGRPDNTLRVVALARCAHYFEKWTGALPPKSRNSRFSIFVAGLFERLGFEKADDMSAQVRKVLALKDQGVNLETWTG